MALRAITFDFWCTLYHARSDGNASEARTDTIQRYLAAGGYQTQREQVRSALDATFQRATAVWLNEQRTAAANERVGWILEALGASLPPAPLAAMVAELEEALLTSDIVLVAGAADALRHLAPRYRLALISDAGMTPGRVLRQFMARDGILGYFQHCAFSDETGHAKPHPHQFVDTLQRLGVRAEEAAHVGDLAATDIAGARAAGMHAIMITGVTQGQDPSQADAVIASFAELLPTLRRFDLGS
jgi:putative hydrolase of the HAD superfamily